jgi:hypothetical protein
MVPIPAENILEDEREFVYTHHVANPSQTGKDFFVLLYERGRPATQHRPKPPYTA